MLTYREFAALVADMRKAQRTAAPSAVLPDPAPDAERTARMLEIRVDLAIADVLDGPQSRQRGLFDPREE